MEYSRPQVSGLPSGTYNWRVKSPKYLANGGTFTFKGAPGTSVEMGTTHTGDCNDNVVNVADFMTLHNSYSRTSGDPGYDDRAKLTGDGIVNASDFVPLRINFGAGGAPPPQP
jgi:hypothetical protein